jgi:hypothetical protein
MFQAHAHHQWETFPCLECILGSLAVPLVAHHPLVLVAQGDSTCKVVGPGLALGPMQAILDQEA